MGSIVVSVGGPKGQADPTLPLLRVATNSSLGGTIAVHLANNSQLLLPQYGASYVSNWTLALFKSIAYDPSMSGNTSSVTVPMRLVSAEPGISFMARNLASMTSLGPATAQSLAVSGLSCSLLSTYYSDSPSALCSACTQNSSCAYCGSGVCTDSGQCPDGSNEWQSCCAGGTCGDHGVCSGSASSGYSCSCNFFFQQASGEDASDDSVSNPCNRLSTAGIVVIFCVSAVVLFVVLTWVYYRHYSGQKTRYLAELRENLLSTEDQVHNTSVVLYIDMRSLLCIYRPREVPVAYPLSLFRTCSRVLS